MDTPAKKKILYVITKSNWGGAQRYVFDLATNLPRETFKIAVAVGGEGLFTKHLRSANVSVIPLWNMRRDISPARDAISFSELYGVIKAFHPDIVHLNSSKAGGLGALAARLAGVPRIVYTVHGWPFEERRNPVLRALLYFFSWLTAFLSHTVIVISDYDLQAAQRMPGIARKAIRIYNGIGPLTFGPGDIIRRAFPKDVKITGTIGELTPNKNQVALIEEARQKPNMFVAIVGDGEDRTRLEAKIKEYGLEKRVKLFGFIPAAEALRGFDTFALPSLKEGLPYVLLEARAAGLPIIANRVGGVGEILDAKNMGEFSIKRMVEKTAAMY